jgi:hypothetical protein
MQAHSYDRPEGVPLLQKLRAVHLEMVDAVLGGEGLQRVAGLAAKATGGAVSIVIPRLSAAVISGDDGGPELAGLRRYVGERVKDHPAPVPKGVTAEVPIASGDEIIGAVILLGAENGLESIEVLHLAAVASLTEVAVEAAREEVELNLRGSFLEELRSRPDFDPPEIVRRAGRLGCDVSRGAVVLCAELTTDRPRHVVATITGEYAGALAQHMDDRVYALLPAVAAAPGGPGDSTLAAARKLATRLHRFGTVGISSFYSDPAELGRAIGEAELVLDVLRRSDGSGVPPDDIGTGTYRLLFRVLASHPEEVRSFYDDTVAALVKYDDQYRTTSSGRSRPTSSRTAT